MRVRNDAARWLRRAQWSARRSAANRRRGTCFGVGIVLGLGMLAVAPLMLRDGNNNNNNNRSNNSREHGLATQDDAPGSRSGSGDLRGAYVETPETKEPARRRPVTTIPSTTSPERTRRVAYVVTVTDDGPFIDGAAVLAHSIRKSHERSRYEAVLCALVSPRVGSASRNALLFLGFGEVLEKELPINVSQIEGQTLRSLWSTDPKKGGCCGAWELLKLYAWTLTGYDRVVHVDMDCMLLQPIDELFEIDAPLVYTSDYNMMNQKQRARKIEPAVQGGFLVVKPSLDTFRSLVAVSQAGHWGGNYGSGWERSGIGGWWGGSTIQGLLPYYFSRVSTAPAVEVDRCVYDNMVDKAVVDPGPRVGASACRKTDLNDVKFVHFTVCQKPWTCNPNRDPDDADRLCLRLHQVCVATSRLRCRP
ncbi:hypothetical protein CTAYLR_003389 [Chrysophaeum taylorii]|uniref:Hexosyltransferase n=1 Tax=Chrysophaeum taylorii TaxID=2483200 RepID=A0AAD7XFV1_9STRA|nr:hypothetical protein CTAYLR_003389 [Chrysophaeum taylorii]